MTIFDRIDIWLTANKVSRRQLAIAAGLPPTSLQSVLTRRKTLSHDMLDALSRAMGVTADYLLRGTAIPSGITLEWISVEKRLPEKSGQVLVAFVDRDDNVFYNISDVQYSSRHKAFNVYDYMDEKDIPAGKRAYTPDYWMPMPKPPRRSKP